MPSVCPAAINGLSLEIEFNRLMGDYTVNDCTSKSQICTIYCLGYEDESEIRTVPMHGSKIVESQKIKVDESWKVAKKIIFEFSKNFNF